MAFNSSLLKATDSGSTGIELQSVVKNIDTRPPIYNFLEYNSDVQDIEFASKVAQYKLLVEGVYFEDNNQPLDTVNEGMISNVFDKLQKIIQRVIQFIKRIVKDVKDFLRSEANKNSKSINKPNNAQEENELGNKLNKPFKGKVFAYRGSRMAGMIESHVSELVVHIATINKNADNINFDMDNMFNDVWASICDRIPELDRKNDISNVSELKTLCIERLSYSDEEKPLKEWLNYYEKRNNQSSRSNWNSIFVPIIKASDEVTADLERCNSYIEKMKKKSEEERSEADRNIIAFITKAINIISGLSTLIAALEQRTMSMVQADKAQYETIYKIVYGDSKVQNESAFFHGEPFNSDTLFDNEDMRDFNRTEWMDLNLTVECYEMKHVLTQSRQNLIVNEALIFTDNQPNKIGRLKALREAEEKKSGGKIAALVDNIRKILQKFISALTSKFNNLAGYIRKYKAQIDKPITFTSNMKSNGDILAGMYRVQSPINIIPFDYNSMKDDLKDKKTFFAKRILPSLNKTVQSSKRNVKWTDDMEVATYCKIYFGASMPQDKYPMCEFTASNMDSNKGNIVRYLSEKNMAFSAKTDLNKLEAESKKINVSAAAKAAAKSTSDNKTTSSNNTAAEKPASGGDTNASAPKTESMYYSELYQRWITEADIDMGNVAQNAGDTSSANADNEIFKAFRVYMDTYKDVIFAKMTGAEFVFSELKQLIVMHAVKNGAPKPGPDPVQPQGPAAKN